MTGCKLSLTVGMLAAIIAARPSSAHADAIFFGPTPYLQHSDSPFSGLSTDYAYLEDFEDGMVNTTGLTSSGGLVIGSDQYVDSVDSEDGFLDGTGSTGGHSLWSAFENTALTFSFDTALLGSLPTYAGLVWTDIGYNAPTPYYGPVSFEAFGATGQSLGAIGPYTLGDGSDTGQTGEDRFFGVYDPLGISAIRISTNNKDWELDDVQYGRATVPEPSTMLLTGLGLASLLGYSGRRSKKAARTAL